MDVGDIKNIIKDLPDNMPVKFSNLMQLGLREDGEIEVCKNEETQWIEEDTLVIFV